MAQNKIFLGNAEINSAHPATSGEFVHIGREKYYCIRNYHEMPDFFISIVSDSNHWMFISSNGSLTAGRKDRDNALFPYYTEDKIHDYKDLTGSKTCFLVRKGDKTFLWEPFTDESKRIYRINRNLYKSVYGNRIFFEETNEDLGLVFRYGWSNSDSYGFIKQSTLTNRNYDSISIEVLDGIQNILPPGIDYHFQNEYSNLLDAYKKSERVESSTLGLFMLSAIPVDRAEPSEALKTTTVWSSGLDPQCNILLSGRQLSAFRSGQPVEPEYDVRAARGAYFLNARLVLTARETADWMMVAEINQDAVAVANLNRAILEQDDLSGDVLRDINKGTEELKKRVACADGFQMTGTDLCCARHFTNTLFNIMRGGVFSDNYAIDTGDFRAYLKQISHQVIEAHQHWINSLPEAITYPELIAKATETGNSDLLRVSYEYLPLTFSRRHGDPSRPWNLFSIETKTEDGQLKYYYAGNWRDIFQNWEALSYSYPEFTEGIISKFLNASTLDGYNPYRIMRDGIDWESPDPEDPWAYIGYWGDHQIIYLQKLLEVSDSFHPGKLDELLTQEIFTYAHVPYEIKSYAEIVQNPKDTVVFNFELNDRISKDVAQQGADARLIKSKAGDGVYNVNMAEKILVTLLSKLSNFIPEAGIWLNTQRPEWNDANNALVGNGTSMVTLYYLRRFVLFWHNKFNSTAHTKLAVSAELAKLFTDMNRFFAAHVNLTESGFTDADRKTFADHLGSAHARYRSGLYSNLFSGKKEMLQPTELVAFCKLILKYIDQSIAANRRKDGLYHAYNIISFNKDGIAIRHLYEMLEGQVAVLSSGFLSSQESLVLLDTLKQSDIYRADQYSYMLYPDRQLPRFTEKNNIPRKAVQDSHLLQKLIADQDSSIVKTDQDGVCHFNAAFRNAEILANALDKMKEGPYKQMVEQEKDRVLELYETLFDHQSFTGRSGTFFGYEGLGSIYWHMVSKLLLATQECFFNAKQQGADEGILGRLKAHYYEIKAGIGLYKSPELYGAFPTDAYSHTPAHAGVKQPGLTGQVKEDVISRIGELGLFIKGGKMVFDPALLNHEEVLTETQEFDYYPMHGGSGQIKLEKDQIAFTFCQVPIVCTVSEQSSIQVFYSDGKEEFFEGNSLNEHISRMIFSRSGEIRRMNIAFVNS